MLDNNRRPTQGATIETGINYNYNFCYHTTVQNCDMWYIVICRIL